ncbi:LiaF transmembrane domain-containing protein [Paenibacillus alkalitolerans]|uniref:LiaF transmembrane domain-containing protein n=1 Tax=Paenibacillus alkalitolerans TaxID=2799335 RepID=UPI0018F5E37E|nr:hypothetical protein [Paenibacillus alkalitolerans]
MKWNGKMGLGIALIAVGGLFLLSKLGLPTGNLLHAIIPAAMVLLGWYGIKHGRSTIGWIVLTIGLIGLIGMLSGWIAVLLPIALIWAGWSLLKSRSKAY